MNRLLLPLMLLTFTAIAHADNDNPTVYPPHIVKPTLPSLAPSGLTPAQVSAAYGFNFVPYQGAGQIIGIIDAYDNPNVESDLAVFNSAFNLPACTTANGCFTKVYATGTQPAANATWALETSLDVQWAHAIAPQAKILLVEAADSQFSSMFTAMQVAINQGAKTLSLSWGAPEFSSQTTGFDPTLRTFVLAGATMFAASGDNGYGVMYPAASTYVIAVGGTTLSLDSSGNYASESAWSGSGGGLSAYEPETTPQLNYPLPSDPNRKRGVPDVSYHANPNNGYSVYDTGSGGWVVVGGTSAAAPQWAAFLAIAKSGTHKKLTSVYNALYTASKLNNILFFNDISSGTNGSCGYYCTARSGYDYITGLGSPQAYFLVNQIIYYS